MMYSALKKGEITNITSSNYTKYMGKLSDFSNYGFAESKYYKTSDLSALYNMTDVWSRFEHLLQIEDTSWYEVYNDLSKSDKVKVAYFLKELDSYEFEYNNIASNIKKWDVTQFFIGLEVLDKYQYAITAVDMGNYSNKNKAFNRVNNDYALNIPEKALIIYLLGNYNWSDINDDNKEDIFDYFDEKYDVEDCGAILEVLGYEVVYKKDGSFTAYW